MDENGKREFERHFLETVGANRSSKDVRWPMTWSLRESLTGRSSGLRRRSQAALARRTAAKVQRGYMKGGKGAAAPAATAPTAAPAASSSSTAAPAAPSGKGKGKQDRGSDHWNKRRMKGPIIISITISPTIITIPSTPASTALCAAIALCPALHG